MPYSLFDFVGMGPFSEQDLKYAAEFRAWVHEEVLKKVQEKYPEIDEVVDPHPVEAYFQQVWDYPGAWYTIVAIPECYKSRKALVDTLVKLTIEEFTR